MTTTRGLRSALCVCLLLAPLATLAAQANDDTMGGSGLYVSAAYGVALPVDRKIDDRTIPTDLGLLGGQVGLGFHLLGFRPELSAGYRTATIKDSDGKGSLSSLDVIASVYYDVGIGIVIVPYVGVGGGVSQFSITEAARKPRTAWPLTFQGAAGVGFNLGQLTLTLGYRLRGTTAARDVKLPDADDLVKMGLTHNAEVGLRYSF